MPKKIWGIQDLDLIKILLPNKFFQFALCPLSKCWISYGAPANIKYGKALHFTLPPNYHTQNPKVYPRFWSISNSSWSYVWVDGFKTGYIT